MSAITLSSLGLDTMEMRCPYCQKTQQIATRALSLEPRLTACAHCKTMLVYQLHIKEKPNNILLTLKILSVMEDKSEAPTENTTNLSEIFDERKNDDVYDTPKKTTGTYR